MWEEEELTNASKLATCLSAASSFGAFDPGSAEEDEEVNKATKAIWIVCWQQNTLWKSGCCHFLLVVATSKWWSKVWGQLELRQDLCLPSRTHKTPLLCLSLWWLHGELSSLMRILGICTSVTSWNIVWDIETSECQDSDPWTWMLPWFASPDLRSGSITGWHFCWGLPSHSTGGYIVKNIKKNLQK